ncbi:hypothetical protein CKAN_01100300 [Cinnamomum micranthum f. kanehirae]|uniref:Late embryogenesis abundant protein LEA-2 subgroup domain-containing protein n=1 Tax=Cinnamomum micranthum f. kanehirae TaxID=337451 RepID=A0A3S3QBS2_9MAGN|nr:hypothetical protein CKAN_01100300 [Cinnamomum micranthum f. kanehirae]
MSQPKQVPLNGAFYGPPIPSQQPPHQPHRGCCLLSALIKFIAIFIILSGIATVVLWIILSPSKMKVHVEKASLMQFNLTNGATLNYNLTLEMSVRNPNKKIGVYYDRMEARAYYDGYRFGFVPLPTFYQENKNTTTLYPNFFWAVPRCNRGLYCPGFQQRGVAWLATLHITRLAREGIRSIPSYATSPTLWASSFHLCGLLFQCRDFNS